MSSRSAKPDLQIAARFKQVREHLNLNQIQMAELCKISQPMVTSIEKGAREINASSPETNISAPWPFKILASEVWFILVLMGC